MEHDGRGRPAGLDLVRDQGVVEVVEAVGLGGRPVGVDQYRPDRWSPTLSIAAAVKGSLR
jgi:hypothetical protein